jgi:hypothetical protein
MKDAGTKWTLNHFLVERDAMNTSKMFRSTSRVLKSTCAAAMAIAGLSLSASAQTVVLDPDAAYYGEELGRPVENLFSGMTTYTEPQGGMEFSLSGAHERAGDARNSSVMARVEYGVTDNLQAHVQFPFDIADRSSGMEAQTGASRIEAGAKLGLIDDNSPVALSIGGDIEVPLSASGDVSGERPGAGPLFKPSLMVGGGGGSAEVHASAQAELGGDDNALNYSVGSIFNTGSAITPSLELSSRAQDNAAPQFYATPGVTYSFSDRAELGVGAGIGLNEVSDDVQLMARFSFNLR